MTGPMHGNDPSKGPRGCRANDGSCGNQAIKGGDVCRMHGGNAPQVRAKAAVRAEVMAWGLGNTHVDPGEMLLRLVSQASARVERYSALLEAAYASAEQVAAATQISIADLLTMSGEDAEQFDGERFEPVDETTPTRAGDIVRAQYEILARGGVAVLIGKSYSAAGKDGSIFATGEAVRGLVLLEQSERKILADLCCKAIAAGLAERQLRIAERMGAAIASVIKGTLRDLGIDYNEDRVWQILDKQMQLVEGSAS